MATQDEFDSVVASLYEAAGQPEHWTESLSGLTKLLGAFATNMIIYDNKTARPFFIAKTDNYSDEALQLYGAHYGKQDVLVDIGGKLPIGRPFLCSDYVSDDFVRQSAYYNEFLIPSGGRYVAAARLIERGDIQAGYGIHRGLREGPFEGEHVRLLERLTPHLVRSTNLLYRFLELRQASQRFSDALDRVPWAVIVVARDGRILSTNRAAEEILRQADGLAARLGHLTSVRHVDAQRLQSLIAAAATTAGLAFGGGGGSVAIERVDGSKWAVLVAPLADTNSAMFGAGGPNAILFITDPRQGRDFPTDLVRQVFGLSAAEARVALGLAAGQSLDDLAEANGLSKNTVRNHMQAILGKTGTNRQSELVRLLMGLPSVRRHD